MRYEKDMTLVKKTFMFLLAFILLTCGCRGNAPQAQRMNIRSNEAPQSKRVILLIVDSLMDKPLQEAIRNGRAPAFSFLMKHGRYVPNVVSSFPTMSVTIDSTLLTGTHPDRHRVPGLVWYKADEKRVVNYGSGAAETVKLGVKRTLMDGLTHLNNQHLSRNVETIHEAVAKSGKQSASVNALLYRGPVKHRLQIPRTVATAASLPKELDAYGPKLLSLGALAKLNPENRKHFAWDSYGINDAFTANELIYLIKRRQLPELTVAYFPDNDHVNHRRGPETTRGIQDADKLLGDVLNAFGSREEALKRSIWIVLGDSGQTHVDADRDASVIDLDRILDDYGVNKLSDPVRDGGPNKIVLGVNERMAYVYSVSPALPLSELAERLRMEKRIDLIAWKENGGVRVASGGHPGSLYFRAGGGLQDEYGQHWTLDGDTRLLDISLDAGKAFIRYGVYPDALQRLYAALHSHAGDFLAITAVPGAEFAAESTPTHLGGGGHGSLHVEDTAVSLIVAGTSSSPAHWRIVDLKAWMLDILKKE